jgi:hypothetical protein
MKLSCEVRVSTKKLLLLFILSLSGKLSAKQWVLIPLESGSHKLASRTMALAHGMHLHASIDALDLHMIDAGDTKPDAPEGYRIEELQKVSTASNDPLFPQQWNLDRVMAPQAWADASTSSTTQPLVAVVDTGIDSTHPDLAGVVVGGANFVETAGSTAALPSGSWADQNNHGTFCASILAAVRNNNLGMAGVSQSQLLAVRVLDANGAGYDFNVAQGMVWAVDQGAKILSISLGTSSPSTPFQMAVSYAQQHGVLVIAAAGNGGAEGYFYPAALDGVLAVGASTVSDTRASYSTYNNMLSIMAPGGDNNGDIIGAIPGGGYAHGTGTSFACPQVAGAAAIYFSLHPNASSAEVFAAITSTADPIDLVAGKSATTGWGRLNIQRLLGQGVAPNLFALSQTAMTISAQGTTFSASIGAAEPDPLQPLNPDHSSVQNVWAVLTEMNGTELARYPLSAGPNSNAWSANLSLPSWQGSSPRQLSLSYQAQDSAGRKTALLAAATISQAAGAVLPNFAHVPPLSAPAGTPLTLHVSQSASQNSLSQWTLHYHAPSGSWQNTQGSYTNQQDISFTVPASDVQIDHLEYYFSAVDAEGEQINVGKDSNPYNVPVYASGETLKLQYISNPAPELCVRLMASAAGTATVDFFDISGELVGSIHTAIRSGENRICLGQNVASGVYFGVARIDGQSNICELKLAIRR